MRLTKILFPVDFSDRCAGIAPSVAAITEFFGSGLTLLYAASIPTFPEMMYPAPLYSALRKELRAASEEHMKRFVARHFPSAELSVVVKEGDAAEIITNYAREHAADLIMMPTHGYGPFRRFLVGSVTSKVLHDALCPVWTLSGVKRRLRSNYQRILCAVDCNSAAVPVIRWAGWLARRYGARLEFVHVTPGMDEKSKNRGEVELRKYFTRCAMDEFLVLLDQAGYKGRLLLRGGNLPTKLAETARQQQSDLVVIGRGHTRKAMGRLRTHSLAIVREVPCPVLSV
jgi:nucleotide-binding universal stress UspA family protein